MTTLVVDNYDSFTWNLVQHLGSLGERPVVVRNDEVTLSDVRAMRPSHVVFSPGPGHPDDPARTGICRAILRELAVPILGVCLGHQLVVSHFGGRIVRAEPVHGKQSLVFHDGDTILQGMPRPFEAMRYHSLVADRASLPRSLAVTAWCKDGTVMAVRHVHAPVFGLQFHPESIGTPCGRTVLRAFLAVRSATDARASRYMTHA
jgi:anthranilate synthase/aminodeoxychorismate synthase-like glutamine amidotransferase